MPPCRTLTRALALAVASIALPGCFVLYPDTVTRRVQGRTIEGRYVSEEAYAAHLAGALAEESGDPEGAERAFREAARQDPSAPEPWVRIGAIRCKMGSMAVAERAFALAEQRDPQLASVHLARAECLLSQGDRAGALAAARRAFAEGPGDPSAVLLLARLEHDSSNPTRARRYLDELRVRASSNREVMARLDDLERELGLVHHDAQPAWQALRRALRAGDLGAAQRSARALGLTPTALAREALDAGAFAIARSQALRLVEADPDNHDARVVLLSASLSMGQVALLDEAVAAQMGAPRALSPWARAELLRVIDRVNPP